MKRYTALVLSICLALSLSLTGCGRPSSDATLITIEIGSATESGDASSDASGDAETVTVSYGLGNFYAQLQQTYDYWYAYYLGDDFWSDMYDESSDATYADYFLEEYMDDLTEMVVVAYFADDYDVTLSEDDETQIAETAAEFIEENAGEGVKAYGTNEDSVAEYLRIYTLYWRITDLIVEDCDVVITEEEAACRTFSYISLDMEDDEDASGDATESGDASSDATESGDAEEEEEVTIEELTAALEESDFDTVMETYDVDVDTYSYAQDEEDFAEDVIAAADELSEGEVAGPIEVEDEEAVYIIRLDSEYDEEATEEKMEELQEEAEDEYLSEVIEEYLDRCEITYNEKLMKKISFDTSYTYTYEDESGDASGDSTTDTDTDSDTDTTETEVISIETETDTDTDTDTDTVETEVISIETDTDTDTDTDADSDT